MKLLGETDVDFGSDRKFDGNLEARDIEEAGVFGWVDEDVEIAAFGVVAVEGGAEEAWVGHAGLGDEAADEFAMLLEDFRWPHRRIV
jgi:hypothetical protein